MKRKLILVADFWRQIADWKTVAKHIKDRAPDIGVEIVPKARLTLLNGASDQRLVVAVQPLKHKVRGEVATGRAIGKWREYERLRDADIPVPRSMLFEPGVVLDPDEWGQKVIVKPLFGQQGRGVRLVRTEAVAGLDAQGQRLMVQKFIDTGDRPWSNRVAALFGRVLYSTQITAAADGIAASNRTPHKVLAPMKPVFADMARRCHEAFPEIPMHGIDLLTDAKTGEVYVAEINSRGFTWHFSSAYGRGTQARYGMNFYRQYGAMSVAADALIDRINVLFPAEAVA